MYVVGKKHFFFINNETFTWNAPLEKRKSSVISRPPRRPQRGSSWSRVHKQHSQSTKTFVDSNQISIETQKPLSCLWSPFGRDVFHSLTGCFPELSFSIGTTRWPWIFYFLDLIFFFYKSSNVDTMWLAGDLGGHGRVLAADSLHVYCGLLRPLRKKWVFEKVQIWLSSQSTDECVYLEEKFWEILFLRL